MMDHPFEGPIVEKKGRKNKHNCQQQQNDQNDESFDDENFTEGDRYDISSRLSSNESFTNLKQRRKQLKPIKIATNLEDMVKVPKQIIGLNNDLDNINDMSHIVPKETSSKSGNNGDEKEEEEEEEGEEKSNSLTVNDVHYDESSIQTEALSGRKSHDSNSSLDLCFREIDKLEVTEINVPKLETGPKILADPMLLFPFRFHPFKVQPIWIPGHPRIFNIEAYCAVCKKEFCNKYFLRTHKANKHGIANDKSAKAMKEFADCIKAMSKVAAVESEITESEGDCKQPFCQLCNRKYAGKYFSRRKKTKCQRRANDEISHNLAFNSEPNIVQSSSCSTNETGSTFEPLALISKDNDSDSDNQDREKGGEEPLNLSSKETVGNGYSEEHAGKPEIKTEIEESKDETEMEISGKESEPEVMEDSDGSCENIEKLQTMLLKLTPSEIETKTCNNCNEMIDATCEHKCMSPKLEIKQEQLSEANESSDEKEDYPTTIRKETRRYIFGNRLENIKKIKPTSSFCEICNKELCNKYFMRTHMLRMHGIEIEHGTQLGGVTCNVCNKELCSKYFLRVHKQNTHGIVHSGVGPSTSAGVNHRPDLKSSTRDHRFPSTFTQVCYICNKRFRSPKWLQVHFLNEHGEEVSKNSKTPDTATTTTTASGSKSDEESKEEGSSIRIPKKANLPERTESPETLNVISKLFWENDSLTKNYTCSQCSFTTPVLAFLFVHERSHFVNEAQEHSEIVKPSVSLQNLIHDKTFWQHKITQQLTDCLDLSETSKNKQVSFEQNGS